MKPAVHAQRVADSIATQQLRLNEFRKVQEIREQCTTSMSKSMNEMEIMYEGVIQQLVNNCLNLHSQVTDLKQELSCKDKSEHKTVSTQTAEVYKLSDYRPVALQQLDQNARSLSSAAKSVLNNLVSPSPCQPWDACTPSPVRPPSPPVKSHNRKKTPILRHKYLKKNKFRSFS